MSGSSPKSISISGVETDITIGKELAAVAQKSKALASRDCFEQLEMYLHGRSHDRVCLLFGLLQTGKNTMLRQAIGRMTKEDLSRIAYIKARRTDNMAMMNRDLKKLFTAELNDGNSKIEEMKAEFNRIVSWSKIFDESPMEVKKMICGYIIKKVSVFRDYRVKIEFNINVEQFLNGIDSINECATYELPMAQ